MTVNNLTALLEPLLTVVMGVGVGTHGHLRCTCRCSTTSSSSTTDVHAGHPARPHVRDGAVGPGRNRCSSAGRNPSIGSYERSGIDRGHRLEPTTVPGGNGNVTGPGGDGGTTGPALVGTRGLAERTPHPRGPAGRNGGRRGRRLHDDRAPRRGPGDGHHPGHRRPDVPRDLERGGRPVGPVEPGNRARRTRRRSSSPEVRRSPSAAHPIRRPSPPTSPASNRRWPSTPVRWRCRPATPCHSRTSRWPCRRTATDWCSPRTPSPGTASTCRTTPDR